MSPRLSTKGATLRALGDLDARSQLLAGLDAGLAAGVIAAFPVAKRPDGAADLDRGAWARDASGRLVWVRANT